MALLLHCFCLNGAWKTFITALCKSHAGAFFKEIVGFLIFHFIPRETENCPGLTSRRANPPHISGCWLNKDQAFI